MKPEILIEKSISDKAFQFLKEKEFLTAREAAIYLGISMHCLYKLTQKKSWPIYKPNNKKIYIRKSDIDEWISQSIKCSSKQTSKKANQYLLNKIK